MSKSTHSKTKLPPAKFREDASVLLKRVAGVELRLTPINKLFVIYKKQVAWPYLKGNAACLDIDLEIPKAALEAVRVVLEKQETIRREHALDFDEDDMAYTFN